MSETRVDTPRELLEATEKFIEDLDLSRDLKVVLTWPAHVVADRELTDADRAESQRLADDEWSIRIERRKPFRGTVICLIEGCTHEHDF